MMRALFFKFASFSHINEYLFRELSNAKHKIAWQHLDVEELYPRRKLSNIFMTAWEYRNDLMIRGRAPRGLLNHSVYYYDQLKEKAGRLIESERPDFTFQMQSLWNASLPGVPNFIYTDHTELAWQNYEFYTSRKTYSSGWIEREKITYRDAAHIFAASEYCAESLRKDYHVPAEKISTLQTGYNLSKKMPDNSLKDYRKEKILFVGLDWNRKGGAVLVEAYNKVKQNFPNSTLTIVGCSPKILNYQQIDVVGKVPSSEMEQYYHDATIFCMPSLAEPAGVAIIEAYFYGLPAIATYSGGLKDRVVDEVTGYLVAPNSADELAEKLSILLSSSELRKQMGAEAQKLLEHTFSWEIVADKAMQKIRTIVRNE